VRARTTSMSSTSVPSVSNGYSHTRFGWREQFEHRG
jgi:hypothetical protein